MPEIKSMLALLYTGEDGNDLAMGAHIPSIGWVPMIAARDEQLEALRSMAQEFARENNIRMRVVKFTKGEVLETIEGVDVGE